uniref:G protein-regulated inducer of neurite outgrowth 1 n=1 Tax=Euleptes europaea TaxID=460621 RepID=UPI00254030EA|nr:G protein-regulated inducer of neurite outgrowth 1 [Euleptes europaea]
MKKRSGTTVAQVQLPACGVAGACVTVQHVATCPSSSRAPHLQQLRARPGGRQTRGGVTATAPLATKCLAPTPPREVRGIAWQKPGLEMGSAKEPEALQLLKQEVAPEDAQQPNANLPCGQEKDSCLQNTKCDGGDLTMRNCCVNDLGTESSCQDDTMVDNPNQKEKAPVVDAQPSMDLPAATGTVALRDTGTGENPPEGVGGVAANSDLCHNSEQSSCMKELPSSSTNTCNLLEGKYSGKASPTAEKRNAGKACWQLPAEPCFKGANKDCSSAPASLKHVAFLEPTKNKDESGSVRTGMVHSELDPALATCLQKTSQGQPDASKRDTCKLSSDTCEAEEHLNEGQRDTLGLEASKEAVSEPSRAGTAPGKSGKPGAEMNQLGPSAEMRPPVIKVNTGVGSSGVSETLIPAAASVHEIKHQSTSGDAQTTPGQVTQEPEGLREAPPSSTKGNNGAQEQPKSVVTSTSMNEGHTSCVETESMELLAKTCLFEITAPQQDAGTQVDNRVSLVSVAISPINPPDGSTAFTFHTRGLAPSSSLKSPGPEQKPTKKDVEMQVFIPVETRSVATGPMTPVTKSPQASYPEVHVKGAQEEAPEPVREVSWDEKGMTWEVYGASMEVEVLGMAIQKHLEKQIEEHGRQTVMTPQSTRASSIKGAPRKGEIKRQPSMFRALLQNVRRPRCCSRGGPAVE